MEYNRGFVYIAGRYNKLARDVSNSAWVVGGERIGVTSVDELISSPLLVATKGEESTLLSAGREDIDVRMLGRGRPFLLRIKGARRPYLNEDELRMLQDEINASTKLIVVNDLTLAPSDSPSLLKQGEENKRKRYRALVEFSAPIDDVSIAALNNLGEFVLNQLTPIRVLHRYLAL